MNAKTRKGLLWTVLGVCCMAAGCGRQDAAPQQKQATPQQQGAAPFRFAQLPITYSAVTFIAESQGYPKAQGLNYRSVSLPAGPDVVAALRATGDKGADAGAVAITPVITMIGAGDSPVVLATTLTSNRQAKLVTFASTGVASEPLSLRGKRIGVTRNTNGDIYLSRLLKKGGLSERDVQLVNGRPAELQSLLLRGDIDAAVLWDPFVVQTLREYRGQSAAKKIPDRGAPLVLVDPTLHTLAFNIITTRDKLAARRESMTQLLRAAIEAETYMQAHRKVAQSAMEKWLNLQPGDLDDFFATTQFHVALDAPQVKQWMKEELAWLRENSPDAKIPEDMSPYVDASVLAAIASSRVKP